jgi:hypothetical protein
MCGWCVKFWDSIVAPTILTFEDETTKLSETSGSSYPVTSHDIQEEWGL